MTNGKALLFLCLMATLMLAESIDSKNWDKCVNNCNKYGTCTFKKKSTPTNSTDGEWTCNCLPLYSGDDCGIKWKDDKEWVKLFGVYIAIELLLQLIVISYASYQLYITIVHSEQAGWKKWTLISTIHALAVVGGIIRIINFAVDPHKWIDIFPPALEEVLFNVPIILWVCAGFMLFLYWIELQTLTGIKELVWLRRMRPYLIVFTVVFAAVLLPLCILTATTNSKIAPLLMSAFLIITFLFLIVILTISGLRLYRIMNRIFKETRVSSFKKFVVKLNRYIYVLDTILLVTVITLAIFQFIGARRMKWGYVIMHILLRIEEFGILIVTLLFVGKKKPNKENSSTRDSSASGKPKHKSDSDSQVRGVDIALSEEFGSDFSDKHDIDAELEK